MARFETLRNTLVHTVISVTDLTDDCFSLRFTRGSMSFVAGQHICVGPKDDLNMREYSIYSGEEDDFLEILVKEIPDGYVSKLLKRLKPGSEIKVEGPFGYFTVEEEKEGQARQLYGIASGTGIAPFRCFALSQNHHFTVIHGMRHSIEQYNHEAFAKAGYSYIPCISRDTKHEHFQGRVTDYLKKQDVDKDGIYFLCGNCDMIYEVFDILQSQGVAPSNIKAEVYF